MLCIPLDSISVTEREPRNRRKLERRKTPSVSREFSSFRLPGADASRAIEEFYSSLDSAVALSCLILYRAGDHLQLISKEIDPLHYNCSDRFHSDFSAISFLRKAPFLDTKIDVRAVAMDSFFKAEEACKVTNRRFRDLTQDPRYRESSCAVLHEATRRKISRILGSFDLGKSLDLGSWGPGVTTNIKGRDVSASRKFREERGITSKAHRLFVPAAKIAYPGWFTEEFVSSLTESRGNEVITVPKNSKTDRTIGIEPGINSFFQLGLGRSIRLRLRKAGFDLNSDQKNQQGALIGSLNNSLATVDFSSASDTIATEVVRTLLPDDWFFALDSLRSPCYHLDGNLIPYAKFSAMGNGFTFELESLIFVSAALAVCEHLGLDTESVSVFGDDIIIPVEGMALYCEFCDFLGFVVNRKKSFSSGPFRESCGSYYFAGKDVKPIFLKEVISNAKSIYRLVNSIRLLAHRRCSYSGCDRKFRTVWRYLVRRLPQALRAYGPVSSGDACIHVNFDEGAPRLARFGWEGSLHPGFIERAVRFVDEQSSLLQAKLRYPSFGIVGSDLSFGLSREESQLCVLSQSLEGVSGLSSGNEVSFRAVTRIVFKKSMFAPQWYNLGPWI
jgi:hypothetical protein